MVPEKFKSEWALLNKTSQVSQDVCVSPLDVLQFPILYGQYRPEGLKVVNGYAFIPAELLPYVQQNSVVEEGFWDKVVIFCDPPMLGDPILGLNELKVTPWTPMAFIPLRTKDS